ncbi:MAG: RIP metalloprotease, partial [Bacteroidetes bacterium]
VEKGGKTILFYPRTPFEVAKVPDTTAAYKAGLRDGDKILAINNQPVKYFDELRSVLMQHKNQTVQLTVERGGEQLLLNVKVSADGKIGFIPHIYSLEEMRKAGIYQFETKKYGFFESFPAGVQKAYDRLTFYVKQFALILNPSTGAYKGIGGFGAIGNMFPPVWDWQVFWEMTAFLSVILAFMNILPIPALDGGHVMFLLYEIITGRKPNQKVLEYAQLAGMLLLLMLMIYANGNDLLKLFK